MWPRRAERQTHRGYLKLCRLGACRPSFQTSQSRSTKTGLRNSGRLSSPWRKRPVLRSRLGTPYLRTRLSVGFLWMTCASIPVGRKRCSRRQSLNLVVQSSPYSAVSCRKRQRARLGSSVHRLVAPAYEWILHGTGAGRVALNGRSSAANKLRCHSGSRL